jgi:hypothetical protein
MVIHHTISYAEDISVQKFDSLVFWVGLVVWCVEAMYNQYSSVDYKITKLPLFKYSSLLTYLPAVHLMTIPIAHTIVYSIQL